MKLSKKALVGGAIFLLFIIIGLFGEVTWNDEPVQNRVYAFVIMTVVLPLLLIVIGFIFELIKDSIIAFIMEVKNHILKK